MLSWNHSILDDPYFFDNLSIDIPEKVLNQFLVIRLWEKLENTFYTKSKDFVLGVGGADKISEPIRIQDVSTIVVLEFFY